MATALILDCIEYGAGSCRNEDMIIELQARAEAAEAHVVETEAEVARLRRQMETMIHASLYDERDALLAECQAERSRLREQVAVLRALMAQAVQADLDDDAFALESVIVRMADALDDNGHDAR